MDELIQEGIQLKDALVRKTLASLTAEDQKTFDLSIVEGREKGIDYFIDYHLKREIESGRYNFINHEGMAVLINTATKTI